MLVEPGIIPGPLDTQRIFFGWSVTNEFDRVHFGLYLFAVYLKFLTLLFLHAICVFTERNAGLAYQFVKTFFWSF